MRLFHICILAVLFCARSSYGWDKLDMAKSLFRQIYRSVLPTSTPAPTYYDPVEEFRKSKDIIFDSIGITRAFNGHKGTTLARVTGPVNVRRPSLQSVMYYYNYTLVITCESSLERWDCPYCRVLGGHIQMVKLHVNKKWHTKWMVTVDHRRDEIVLTFRPTYNVGTLLLDFFVKQTKVNGTDIGIHTGYFDAVVADYDEMVNVLRQLIVWNPTYKLIITGHSLGGSLSAVMTFLLTYNNVFPGTQIELYTFGQARVGNKAFVDYMNSLHIPLARAVHRDDAAARITPAILDYYHHHNELYMDYDKHGRMTARYCSAAFYEDPDCGQSRGPPFPVSDLIIGIIDHQTYFGLDATRCAQNNLAEFLLQAVWPLRDSIPKEIVNRLPPLAVEFSVFQDITKLFGGGGIRDLYKIASQKSSSDKYGVSKPK